MLGSPVEDIVTRSRLRLAREQHFAADGTKAGRQQRAHGRNVPGRHLGEDRFPVRDERTRRECKPASEPTVAGGGLDLERALHATGQTPADDEHAELLGVGEHPEVGPVPGGTPHPVVETEVVTRRELDGSERLGLQIVRTLVAGELRGTILIRPGQPSGTEAELVVPMAKR